MLAAGERADVPTDPLEAFHDRLRGLCEKDGVCSGNERSQRIQSQAEQALVVAREFGLLKEIPFSWEDLKNSDPQLKYGAEHVVEHSEAHGLVTKTTIPPSFGLIPRVVRLPNVNLRDDPSIPEFRETVEFLPATPLEYLTRWIHCNEVFGDDARLASVARWKDGSISFVITQPQYDGEPAEQREIDAFFERTAWTRLKGELPIPVYFHYGYGLMAFDTGRRNCYIKDGQLLPFDVIICEPDEALERFFAIY